MNESDLKTFETKLRLRPMVIGDFEALIAIQRKAFPGMGTWTKEQIESQLAIFPEGQFVIEIDGRVVASARDARPIRR